MIWEGCAAGLAHYGVLLRTSVTGAGTSVGACGKGLSLVRQRTLAQGIDPSKIHWDVDFNARARGRSAQLSTLQRVL